MSAYLLIAVALLCLFLLLVFFRRSAREVGEEYGLAAKIGVDTDMGEWSDFSSSIVSGIFSSDDGNFVTEHADPLLTAMFRRERKRLALRWVERRKLQAAAIMRKHRKLARSAADLQPSHEVILFLRYSRLRLLCEGLSLSVLLVGPERLRGLAEQADAVFHGVQNPNIIAESPGRVA